MYNVLNYWWQLSIAFLHFLALAPPYARPRDIAIVEFVLLMGPLLLRSRQYTLPRENKCDVDTIVLVLELFQTSRKLRYNFSKMFQTFDCTNSTRDDMLNLKMMFFKPFTVEL
jgi:hypothetical protein